jgi:lipoate-protein ligase B
MGSETTAHDRRVDAHAPTFDARDLNVEWLGRVPYAEALALQQARVEARRRGACGDALLLLEHPPVITLGRGARPENLLVPREVLAARGVEVHEVARGGDVTWHGPGQLVGYLVLDLAARGEPDVHAHLRRIEALLIDALAGAGVAAGRREGMTGVFVEPGPGDAGPPRKIASIGVGLRGWVTYHGFALNVCNAPEGFAAIVPCGLHGVEMTSLRRERPAAADAEADAALLGRTRALVADAARRRLARGPRARRDLAGAASIG